MYVLHEKLQSNLSHNKLIDISRVGIFLNHPHVHAYALFVIFKGIFRHFLFLLVLVYNYI